MRALILTIVSGLAVVAAAPTTGWSQSEVVVAPVVVTGEVTRYEPGRIIVLRSGGREVTYTLTPDISVPADVQLGRNVSIYTERGADGNETVRRVTTTSLTPEGEVKRTTEETRVGESGVVRQKTTTVTGEVVSFVPGRNIVIRRSPGKDVTLTLGPRATLPAEMQVGQRVTLYTEPGPDGNTTVTRVTTTSLTPEGQTKRTVEETRTSPTGETTKTTTVSVHGRVQTYLPGKSVTLLKADGTSTTYVLTDTSQIPTELAMGKMVTIRTMPSGEIQTIVVEKSN